MEPEAHAAQPFEPSCLRMQPSTSPLHSTKAFTHIAVATVNRYHACPRAHPQQELEAPSHKNFKYHVEVAYQTQVRPLAITPGICLRRARTSPVGHVVDDDSGGDHGDDDDPISFRPQDRGHAGGDHTEYGTYAKGRQQALGWTR